MYELHIANKNYSSWSVRPWVLMKTLDIPFRERITPFPPTAPGRSVFKSFSPSGQVPCLVDGDTVVWDTLAIAEYLAERHEGIWPKDAKARAWARSASAEMHSGFTALRSACNMNCGIRVKLKEISPALEENLSRLAELWSDGLQKFGGPFLAGRDFSNVDAFYCPVAFRAQSYNLPLKGEAMAYVGRLLALPAMREWYEAGLKEAWRIERYEADARAAGVVTKDLRAAR
jgi:glutathione S-transferase